MMKWIVIFFCCAAFAVGVRRGYEEGFRVGVKQITDSKEAHDVIMRKIGTCDWAKLMAEDIKCKRQLP